MKKIIALLFLITFTYQSQPLITREFIENLKKEVTWEVEDYEKNIFTHWTEEEFKFSFCSDFEPPVKKEIATDDEDELRDLPTDFDGRKKWPKCIHPIRIQSHCGSCWAFATAEAISDRFCISGKDVILAPQDLVSCDKSNKACGGGYAPYAMKYAENKGILSEKCFP